MCFNMYSEKYAITRLIRIYGLQYQSELTKYDVLFKKISIL